MAKKRSKLLTDQLRQSIDDSGLTRYQIAMATGIDKTRWPSSTTAGAAFRRKP